MLGPTPFSTPCPAAPSPLVRGPRILCPTHQLMDEKINSAEAKPWTPTDVVLQEARAGAVVSSQPATRRPLAACPQLVPAPAPRLCVPTPATPAPGASPAGQTIGHTVNSKCRDSEAALSSDLQPHQVLQMLLGAQGDLADEQRKNTGWAGAGAGAAAASQPAAAWRGWPCPPG